MKSLLEKLVEILKQEIEFHNHLLNLAREKERAIINNQVNLLQEVTRKEVVVINSIKDKEQERIEAIKELARYFEISLKDLTMAKLIELIDEEMSKEFKELHQEIVSLITKLRAVNDRNNALIKTSLELISYSMNLYVNLSAGEAVYSSKGKLKKETKSSFILDRTV